MIVNKPYTLNEIKKLTQTISSFTFKAQDGTKVDFSPGMFAMVDYKDPQTGKRIARAYSIASAPQSGCFEFIIALIHGAFTSKLEAAKVGDVYYISAPYGQFKFDINYGKKFLFLAGGTGLAPFLSMIRFVKNNGAEIDCKILYSTRYSTEIINKQELDDIKTKMNVDTYITVTRPAEGDGWAGLTGHIDADMIKSAVPDATERISYICGPPVFVKALKDALLSLGVNEKDIKAEMWGK